MITALRTEALQAGDICANMERDNIPPSSVTLGLDQSSQPGALWDVLDHSSHQLQDHMAGLARLKGDVVQNILKGTRLEKVDGLFFLAPDWNCSMWGRIWLHPCAVFMLKFLSPKLTTLKRCQLQRMIPAGQRAAGKWHRRQEKAANTLCLPAHYSHETKAPCIFSILKCLALEHTVAKKLPFSTVRVTLGHCTQGPRFRNSNESSTPCYPRHYWEPLLLCPWCN